MSANPFVSYHFIHKQSTDVDRLEITSKISNMNKDIFSGVQDFLAEQFGYEVCRWQVAAACVLILIVLMIGGFMYVRDHMNNGKKVVRVALKKEQPAKQEKDVCVYVCGAVAKPGVYRLKEKSRIVDAVNICGGFAADADLNVVNLAKLIGDGERIWIPKVGESNNGRIANQNGNGPLGSEKINVNTANVDELDSLPGIGKTLAENIISYRDEHGPFQDTDQLLEVDGIGPKKLSDLKDKITL